MPSLHLLSLLSRCIHGWMLSVSRVVMIPVFFSLFVSKEVSEKFHKAADDKKKASSALPHWGDVCPLGDLPDFHKAPKVNKSFSRLLDKPVSSSRYVTLSLEDATKLETRVLGQIESQSFSLWALATVFDFLKDPNCVPDDIFSQLVSRVFWGLLLRKSLFQSRSHVPCLSGSAAASPSIGPSGGTRGWNLGWWRSWGRDISSPSHCLLLSLRFRFPFPARPIPRTPSRGMLYAGRFFLL